VGEYGGSRSAARRRTRQHDVGVLAAVGHEALLLRAVGLCVAAFDKAIAGKDLAELRTERGLCKLGSKDPDGAMADFAAA